MKHSIDRKAPANAGARPNSCASRVNFCCYRAHSQTASEGRRATFRRALAVGTPADNRPWELPGPATRATTTLQQIRAAPATPPPASGRVTIVSPWASVPPISSWRDTFWTTSAALDVAEDRPASGCRLQLLQRHRGTSDGMSFGSGSVGTPQATAMFAEKISRLDRTPAVLWPGR